MTESLYILIISAHQLLKSRKPLTAPLESYCYNIKFQTRTFPTKQLTVIIVREDITEKG